jgi:hypothetical protein
MQNSVLGIKLGWSDYRSNEETPHSTGQGARRTLGRGNFT